MYRQQRVQTGGVLFVTSGGTGFKVTKWRKTDCQAGFKRNSSEMLPEKVFQLRSSQELWGASSEQPLAAFRSGWELPEQQVRLPQGSWISQEQQILKTGSSCGDEFRLAAKCRLSEAEAGKNPSSAAGHWWGPGEVKGMRLCREPRGCLSPLSLPSPMSESPRSQALKSSGFSFWGEQEPLEGGLLVRARGWEPGSEVSLLCSLCCLLL